jgi:methionyl-tRNA synthetase
VISFDDFAKIDLRTAKVLAAGPHPDADRLVILKVDLGELGERQIIAGIRQWYAAEDLVGKTIVVVANLEPAKLRGELSEGMLLAVKDGDTMRLLVPDGEIGAGVRAS